MVVCGVLLVCGVYVGFVVCVMFMCGLLCGVVVFVVCYVGWFGIVLYGIVL